MSWTAITEEEAYDHLEMPFNPPHEGAEEGIFIDEWSQVRDQVGEVLRQFGEPDPYGDKDFYVGETTSFSRGIGVSLTSSEMITPLLVPAIQRFLSDLKQDYEVSFTIEVDGNLYQMFVSSSAVKAWLPKTLSERLR